MMSVTGILVGSLFYHTLSAQRADEHEEPEQRLAHARASGGLEVVHAVFMSEGRECRFHSPPIV